MRAVRDERDVPRVFLSDVRVLGHVRFFVRVLRQSTRILHDARRHALDDGFRALERAFKRTALGDVGGQSGRGLERRDGGFERRPVIQNDDVLGAERGDVVRGSMRRRRERVRVRPDV